MALRFLPSLALLLLASVPFMVSAADPDPLADFVVSGTLSGASFALKGLNAISVPAGQGSAVKAANAATFSATTAQGISMAFINYAPCGQNPIHSHPRASELLYLISGQLYVGFVDTNNTLFATTLNAGDVFVFPRGLVHFQQNPSASEPATAIAGLNSQNPGTVRVGSALFLPTAIPSTISQVAFNADAAAIKAIADKFPANGNPVGTANTGCGAAVTYPGSRKML